MHYSSFFPFSKFNIPFLKEATFNEIETFYMSQQKEFQIFSFSSLNKWIKFLVAETQKALLLTLKYDYRPLNGL